MWKKIKAFCCCKDPNEEDEHLLPKDDDMTESLREVRDEVKTRYFERRHSLGEALNYARRMSTPGVKPIPSKHDMVDKICEGSDSGTAVCQNVVASTGDVRPASTMPARSYFHTRRVSGSEPATNTSPAYKGKKRYSYSKSPAPAPTHLPDKTQNIVGPHPPNQTSYAQWRETGSRPEDVHPHPQPQSKRRSSGGPEDPDNPGGGTHRNSR